MVRGIYTGASAMAARVHEMNVVANNLANVNTNGFKRDLTLFKAFPEMVVRRQNDDGLVVLPGLGSYDKRPTVGKLGTGVEVSEVFNQKEQGNLKQTESAFDFALQGDGYFSVDTGKGIRYTRNGAFTLNDKSELVTLEGYKVLGERGPITIKTNNFIINDQGEIFVNPDLNRPPQRPVQLIENGFENANYIDRLSIVDFEKPRFLIKEGTSFYQSNEISGEAQPARSLVRRDIDGRVIEKNPTPLKVRQGFLEASNVNPVQEMVKMIEVQRAYEASQKSITSSDEMTDRLINNMARFSA